jgi:hypothetical protein
MNPFWPPQTLVSSLNFHYTSNRFISMAIMPLHLVLVSMLPRAVYFPRGSTWWPAGKSWSELWFGVRPTWDGLLTVAGCCGPSEVFYSLKLQFCKNKTRTLIRFRNNTFSESVICISSLTNGSRVWSMANTKEVVSRTSYLELTPFWTQMPLPFGERIKLSSQET